MMSDKMTFNKSLLIPLGVFFLLVLFLALGFQLKNPHLLPSALINKPFPEFQLRDLHDPEKIRSLEDFSGEVALANVWGTWCPNCLIEHPELLRIATEEGISIYGINYNDDSDKAVAWLQRHENPYEFSVVDDQGILAINLGVYGAPETFVIDRQGVIQFRYVGPVTHAVWQEQLLPVITHLGRSTGE